MQDKTALYSLSISARATLDMHSLNNEGGEGNQIQTRMVNIVGADGRLHNVNAISGDMLKHIQAEHLFRRATASAGLPLCAGCRQFNANRISADEAFVRGIEGKSDAEAIDGLLAACVLDDLAGNLITSGSRSIPRKSVVEFGWVVGIPEQTTTDSYFHVKYVSERSKDRRQSDASEPARGANLGQAIFHRPASSGVYAVVAGLEIARIGFNDITQRYPLPDDERQARYAALLESLLFTFLEPNGAMRGTQNPHIVSFDGALAISSQVVPAPALSPLSGDFLDQLDRVSGALDRFRPGALQVHRFGSIGEFAEEMVRLIETTAPFRLGYAA
jgi:CRISPR-associated protein Cst2